MKKPHSEKIYLYGKNALLEALEAKPETIQKVFLSPKAQTDSEIISKLKKHTMAFSSLKQGEADSKVGGDTVHQGVIAVVSPSQLLTPLDTVLKNIEKSGIENPALVILGELQDPHNVGAIIRSAAGFGASAVIIPEHNQAPITGVVIKTSAGMVFRIPIVQVGNINLTLRTLKDKGYWVYGLVMDGDSSLPKTVFDTPVAFVIGNEGAGIREKTLELCDIKLSIPIDPKCESLNAGTAAAVVLYDWYSKRQ